jgi:hypothetical protein
MNDETTEKNISGYKCDVCGKPCTSHRGMLSHRAVMHPFARWTLPAKLRRPAEEITRLEKTRLGEVSRRQAAAHLPCQGSRKGIGS